MLGLGQCVNTWFSSAPLRVRKDLGRWQEDGRGEVGRLGFRIGGPYLKHLDIGIVWISKRDILELDETFHV